MLLPAKERADNDGNARVRHLTYLGQWALLSLRLLLVVVALPACESGQERASKNREIHVGVAASMVPVLQDLKAQFERSHRAVTVTLEVGGSFALTRKATELNARYDVLVLADTALSRALRRRGWAKRSFPFATDRLVLAHSPWVAESGVENSSWLAEVLKPGVRFGIADPNQAPLGYRSILTLKLEEKRSRIRGAAARVRKKAGERFVSPHASALAVQVEAGHVDYALLYSTTAARFGLAVDELSPLVNLGSPDRESTYSAVKTVISGEQLGEFHTVRGSTIEYEVVASRGAERPIALQFLRLLQGPRARESLTGHGFSPLSKERKGTKP